MNTTAECFKALLEGKKLCMSVPVATGPAATPIELPSPAYVHLVDGFVRDQNGNRLIGLHFNTPSIWQVYKEN